MGTYAVTGGGSGIGAAFVERKRGEGHRVINVDIKNADIAADLSFADGRRAAIDAVAEQAPDGLDGLVPFAGVGGQVPDARLICGVNYFGAVEVVDGLKDRLAMKGGSVVLVSSNSAAMELDGDELIDAFLAGDEAAVLEVASADRYKGIWYMLSKRALAYWMRAHVTEFADAGIRMNAVAPGVVSTPMTDPLFDQMSETMQGLLDRTPLRRAGRPEEIAELVDFLLGEKSAFICGSTFFIDGGYDAATRPRHL